METQRRNDHQPVLGYPVRTATFGSPVICYPVSQFQPPVTATATADAAARTIRVIVTNPSACKTTIKKATKLLLSMLLPLAFLSLAVVMFVAAGSAPKLPNVALTSISATVQNASNDRVTADFDASFLVENRAEKGVAFDHLTAYASEAEAGPIEPFELRRGEDKTVSFRINGVAYRVEEWEVKFGLRADVWYRGKTWSEPRIPIKVSCESVQVRSEWQTQTVKLDEDSDLCKTDGQWIEDVSTFTKIGIGCFLAFIITTILYLSSACYS